jgi:hypothetical protein
MMLLKANTVVLLLSLAPQYGLAAECSRVDQELFEQFAVDQMWWLRDVYCRNYWSQNFRLDLSPGVKNPKTKNTWKGWWYGYGHPDQQGCWVSSSCPLDLNRKANRRDQGYDFEHHNDLYEA